MSKLNANLGLSAKQNNMRISETNCIRFHQRLYRFLKPVQLATLQLATLQLATLQLVTLQLATLQLATINLAT
jgi:hypothetical protein